MKKISILLLIGCSSMTPMEPNDNHDLMNEKLPSIDDMLLEFSLNDLSGDFI
jgi:uncharacterized protein YcfL